MSNIFKMGIFKFQFAWCKMQKLNFYNQIKFPVAADESSNDKKSDKYKDFNRNTQRWLVALTVLVLATLVVGGTALCTGY